MARELTWLHISDLHAGKPGSWDIDRVLGTLLTDLQKMRSEHNLRPDLIFFTGDVAFGEDPKAKPPTLAAQYSEAERFFSRVRTSFDPALALSDFYIVPGNHDVNRSQATPADQAYLAQMKSPDEVHKLLDGGGTPWRNIAQRQLPYRSFLEEHGYSHQQPTGEHILFSSVRNIAGVTIGIGGINSAWSSAGDKEKGKLWSGGEWQLAQIRGLLNPCEISVILIHHPPNWFVESEDPSVGRMIEGEHNFLLHGHEHMGWVDEKDGHVRIAAAACYAKGKQEESGYNFVRLDLDAGKGQSFLRKFDPEGGAWIPRAIANKTDDRGVWPFAWGKRAKGALGVRLRTLNPASASTPTTASPSPDDRVRQVVVPVEPIGRTQVMNECAGLLRTGGVLLVHGAPGQGKTALARYVASNTREIYRDGIFEIDLQNERKLGNLSKHIAGALGADEDVFVFDLLKRKNALLILDSFETLLQATEREQMSRFFDHLLAAANGGQSRVIVTSRDSFDKEGVIRKRLTPLEIRPATELFLRETDGLYASTDPEEISEFVQADLGGHALSIKLVARFAALAARVDLRSLRDLWRLRFNEIAKFESSLDLKPLAAALELSYESLSYTEKRFFLSLSLLPDGLLGSHVSEIWRADVATAYAALAALEQRSLLESEQHHRRILGPLLLYAQAKRAAIATLPSHPLHKDLAADAEAIDAFYDVMVSRYAPQEADENPSEKNLTIRRFFYNIHASFDRRLDPSISVRSLAAAEGVVRLYWAYHNNLGGNKRSLGTSDDALHYLDKAYQIFRINEQHEKAVLCLYYVGNILWLRGDISDARVRLEDVLNSPNAADKLKYNARRAFAHIEYKIGSIAKSASLYKEVASEALHRDDRECFVRCQIGLLDAYRKLEDFESGSATFDAVKELLPTLNASVRGNVVRGMAYIQLASGDLAGAKDLYEEALSTFRNVSPFGHAHCRRGLGDVAVQQGDFSQAQKEFDAAMELYEEAGKLRSLGVGLVMIGRGRLAIANHTSGSAVDQLKAAIELLDVLELNEPYEQAQAYELMGQVLASNSQVEEALGYYQLALQQFRRIDCARPAERLAARMRELGLPRQ